MTATQRAVAAAALLLPLALAGGKRMAQFVGESRTAFYATETPVRAIVHERQAEIPAEQAIGAAQAYADQQTE